MEINYSNKIDETRCNLKITRTKIPIKLKVFTQIPPELFERGRYLSPTAKWVYITLRSFANNKTGSIYPSYQTVIRKSNLSRNTVAKALSELEHFQWITRSKKKGKSNNYELYYSFD